MENNNSKTVVCYGDSNTYGYNPATGSRLPKAQRWTTILQENLGEQYDVIPEGLNGRTVNYDDPDEDFKNGYKSLKAILGSHRPIDILILMLGTNDLKFFYHQNIELVANNMELMVKEAKTFLKQKQDYYPTIVLCSPIPIGDDVLNSCFATEMDQNSLNNSKLFSEYYQKVANKEQCLFFDANKMFKPSTLDCLHMDKTTHYEFGISLAKFIQTL